MFDNLKKKLSNAIKNLVNKEEEAKPESKQEAAAGIAIKQPSIEQPQVVTKIEPKVEQKQKKEEVKPVEHKIENVAPKEVPKVQEIKSKKAEKEEPLVKVSLGTKLKGVVFRSVVLKDSEIEDFAENIKISMLESDVSYETAEHIANRITEELKTKKIESSNINEGLKTVIRDSLFDVLKNNNSGINLYNFVSEKIKTEIPVKILFLGPNGTGKTTTMAKIAHHLKGQGISTVLSASDTFRAAAIEQTEHHANKLGIPVIKNKYGSDPASVAFDAISYAKAHKIQVVLIDSAGRQETNKNLINEIQKIVRIAKPDITIFVGESTAGNALSDQIKEFNKFAKIDGVVLTKLDCDAKGGNAISIADATGIPILFFGIGESYDAIMPYSSEFVVGNIIPN